MKDKVLSLLRNRVFLYRLTLSSVISDDSLGDGYRVSNYLRNTIQIYEKLIKDIEKL